MFKAATALPDAPTRVEDCPDWYIQLACAHWQVARAKLLLTWAETDKNTLFGHLHEGPDLREPDHGQLLHVMAESIDVLEGEEPETTAGALRMVEVAMTVLGDREINPDYKISNGNLRLILRNVARALEFAPDVKLRPSLPPGTDAD